MKAHIFILLYGKEHAALHRRVLDSVHKHAPGEIPVSIRGNLIPDETIQFARDIVSARGLSTLDYGDTNLPKYTVMRDFFTSGRLGDAEWVVWFDDDSYVTAPDWWARTCEYIEARKHENICYIGQPWFVHDLPGQREFIEKASWYRDRPPEMIKGRPGINFAQGAYWFLRVDVLRRINWPDSRLRHNGGDCLLGEAIRQQSLPFHKFHYGVKINDSKRRGFSEKPAGSLIDTRR